jgi:hypothetical protein
VTAFKKDLLKGCTASGRINGINESAECFGPGLRCAIPLFLAVRSIPTIPGGLPKVYPELRWKLFHPFLFDSDPGTPMFAIAKHALEVYQEGNMQLVTEVKDKEIILRKDYLEESRATKMVCHGEAFRLLHAECKRIQNWDFKQVVAFELAEPLLPEDGVEESNFLGFPYMVLCTHCGKWRQLDTLIHTTKGLEEPAEEGADKKKEENAVKKPWYCWQLKDLEGTEVGFDCDEEEQRWWPTHPDNKQKSPEYAQEVRDVKLFVLQADWIPTEAKAKHVQHYLHKEHFYEYLAMVGKLHPELVFVTENC